MPVEHKIDETYWFEKINTASKETFNVGLHTWRYSRNGGGGEGHSIGVLRGGREEEVIDL